MDDCAIYGEQTIMPYVPALLKELGARDRRQIAAKA
jgi:hypothetical protein